MRWVALLAVMLALGGVVVASGEQIRPRLPASADPKAGAMANPQQAGNTARAATQTLLELYVSIVRTTKSDHAVFRFDGPLPAFEVEVPESPPLVCETNVPVEMDGSTMVMVNFTNVQVLRAGKTPGIGVKELPGAGAVLEVEQVCSSAGRIAWVVGIDGPRQFQVLSPDASTLVIEVQR